MKKTAEGSTPSHITDHPYVRARDINRCLCGYINPLGKHCNLAEAAHSGTFDPFKVTGKVMTGR